MAAMGSRVSIFKYYVIHYGVLVFAFKYFESAHEFVVGSWFPLTCLGVYHMLYPKSADSSVPEQFRPLTSSILCRQFHRMLARGLEKSLPLSDRQKAFRKGYSLTD